MLRYLRPCLPPIDAQWLRLLFVGSTKVLFYGGGVLDIADLWAWISRYLIRLNGWLL